jgi:hypothetical protein
MVRLESLLGAAREAAGPIDDLRGELSERTAHLVVLNAAELSSDPEGIAMLRKALAMPEVRSAVSRSSTVATELAALVAHKPLLVDTVPQLAAPTPYHGSRRQAAALLRLAELTAPTDANATVLRRLWSALDPAAGNRSLAENLRIYLDHLPAQRSRRVPAEFS